MWFSFQSGAIAPSMDQGNYLLTSFQHAEASGLTTAAYTSSICIIKTGMPHPTCCWQCTLPQSALWKQECFTQLVGSVHFLNLHYENRNASPNLLLTAYSFSSLPHSKRKFSGRQVIWLWFRFRYRRSGSCKGLSGKAWIWLLSHKQYQMWLLSHKQYQTWLLSHKQCQTWLLSHKQYHMWLPSDKQYQMWLQTSPNMLLCHSHKKIINKGVFWLLPGKHYHKRYCSVATIHTSQSSVIWVQTYTHNT